jgi:anti-sigma B factor antagonist
MNERSPSDLRIEVDHRQDLAVVWVEGQVIRENQLQLRTELERLVAEGTAKIAINLEKVDYMDSAGLGCCSFIRRLLREKASGSMAVFGASSNMEKTWTLIRLDLVIPIFSDEREAVIWLCG